MSEKFNKDPQLKIDALPDEELLGLDDAGNIVETITPTKRKQMDAEIELQHKEAKKKLQEIPGWDKRR